MLVDDVGFNEIFSIEAIIKGTCVILYHVENNLECVYLKIVPICSMAKWEQTVFINGGTFMIYYSLILDTRNFKVNYSTILFIGEKRQKQLNQKIIPLKSLKLPILIYHSQYYSNGNYFDFYHKINLGYFKNEQA